MKTTTTPVSYDKLTIDILDDVVSNEDGCGIWHYICEEHIKYYDVPEKNLDRDAVCCGVICGIRGCNKEAAAYHDMKGHICIDGSHCKHSKKSCMSCGGWDGCRGRGN